MAVSFAHEDAPRLRLDEIRLAARAVMARAVSLRADLDRLDALADELDPSVPGPAPPDPSAQPFGDPETTAAFVLTLDSINFGSGWFPLLVKRAGFSGYFTLATALREHFDRSGPWSAPELCQLDAARLGQVLGQARAPTAVQELLELFAGALRDLGRWLLESHGGRFLAPVERARGSAERLAESVCEMPLFRDVAHYDELRVPFYKRAQILAADFALAFEGRGPGAFRDLDRLSVFADNLVPHVLRCLGALHYTPELAQRIDAGEEIPSGSHAEIEIRAAAVFAGERIAARARARGRRLTEAAADRWLWTRGQHPEIKARPRHRTRSSFY